MTRRRLTLALVALLPLAASSSPARAETRRLAVLVGNNVGTGVRPPLRYAERDAEKLQRRLVGGDIPACRIEAEHRLSSSLRHRFNHPTEQVLQAD